MSRTNRKGVEGDPADIRKVPAIGGHRSRGGSGQAPSAHRVPLTVVLPRNEPYGALRWFGCLLGVPDTPGLDTPGLHFTHNAHGYGVPARHVDGSDELRAVLSEAPDGPRLVQIGTALTTPLGEPPSDQVPLLRTEFTRNR
ncbi:hypothetical protein AB5J72_03825 [Streptomyces sp. CG1]|uniref:hypothetical protein n=1 Tax=Streptomyces sp. CG1 TaxID=1287523 RepID=UPI0034E274D1